MGTRDSGGCRRVEVGLGGHGVAFSGRCLSFSPGGSRLEDFLVKAKMCGLSAENSKKSRVDLTWTV